MKKIIIIELTEDDLKELVLEKAGVKIPEDLSNYRAFMNKVSCTTEEDDFNRDVKKLLVTVKER